MSKNTNACLCGSCAGATCTCGCQKPAAERRTECRCGDVCNCGRTCACSKK